MQITEEIAAKVLKVVDAGLVSGMGFPKPGQMCVEAAVCFALGQPHGDEPSCVHPVVRRFKIALNDSSWSSNKARARGLRRIAVAQLGSTEIDAVKFSTYVAEHTVRRIVPMALEAAAKLNPGHAEKLLAASKRCADEGSSDAASYAARAASDAARAASDAASDAARAASDAASYAARAASDAARAASDAASYAARAASYAARDAARDASYAASDAARAASYAARDAARAASDRILSACADIGVEALIACKSDGVKFLGLAE